MLGLIAALAALVLAAPSAAAVRAAVADTPVASFTSSPPSPHVGHPVSFDASASHDPDGEAIAQYRWTFGGEQVTTASPTTTHVFASPGTFAVSLVVVDASGNQSAAVSSTITVAPDVPKAKFTVKPSSTNVGKTVKFNGSASFDADGDAISSYQWTYGDGTSATTSGPTTSHVYAVIGTYRATLLVVDSHGNASAPVSHTVKVFAAYPVPTPPTARFTFSPARPLVGQLVTFDASASGDTDGDTITSYRWSFGDHTSQTTPAAVTGHSFGHAGTFTVKLVVLDSHGSKSKTVSAKVLVSVPPRPRITGLHVRVCRHRSRRCRRLGLDVRFRLSAADRVVLTIRRRHHRRVVQRIVLRHAHAGRNSVHIRFARRRSGHYVLSAHAVGGGTATARFVWHRR